MLHAARPSTRLRRLALPMTLAVGVALAATVSTTASPAHSDELAGAATATRVSAVTPAVATTASPAEANTETAKTALADARAAVSEATTVTTDVANSGVTVQAPATTVDTAELSAQIDAMASSPATSEVFAPVLAEKLATQSADVRTRVASLRSALDAALAQKAAEEAAAAAAAAEAQRKAEAEAAAAATSSRSGSGSSGGGAASAPAVGPVDPGSAQGIARSMIAGYGWGDDQFGCLVALWNRESGWRVNAGNASGAYGIPQALPGSKMASAGADWASNPATQIAWGLSYITGRYGDACSAWGHSESTGWY